jgi:hypothetical protein
MGGVLSRPPIFWPLAVLFGAFVLFLYGPIATIGILAFQGPEGGLVFPMNGVRCTGSPPCSSRSRSAISGAPSIARSCWA